MVCPQVVDGGDSLQIWSCYKYTEQAVSESYGVVLQLWGWAWGLKVSHSKKKKTLHYEMLHKTSDLNGFYGTI
jgi:hypothetical protein